MQPILPDDYRAVREAAALLDRSGRGRIAAVGSDRLSYLHAMLTNDVAALGPGRGCYAAYLSPQGRMIADMRVLELGDLTLIDVEGSARALVLEKLDQYIFSEDVRVMDLSADLGAIGIYGPRAADVVAGALAPEEGAPSADGLAVLAEYASVRAPFKGGAAVVTGDRDLGVAGFIAYIDRERMPSLAAAVRDAGAGPIDAEVSEVLRIEAGRPRFGVDMDEHTIPLEAGIEGRAISFTKGCYPGQEVITRVLHRGHGRIARKLVGLVVAGGVAPTPGDRVVSGEAEVGTVTSAAMSPLMQAPIALAYVQREFTAPGTGVAIVHGGVSLGGKTASLPFVGT